MSGSRSKFEASRDNSTLLSSASRYSAIIAKLEAAVALGCTAATNRIDLRFRKPISIMPGYRCRTAMMGSKSHSIRVGLSVIIRALNVIPGSKDSSLPKAVIQVREIFAVAMYAVTGPAAVSLTGKGLSDIVWMDDGIVPNRWNGNVSIARFICWPSLTKPIAADGT